MAQPPFKARSCRLAQKLTLSSAIALSSLLLAGCNPNATVDRPAAETPAGSPAVERDGENLSENRPESGADARENRQAQVDNPDAIADPSGTSAPAAETASADDLCQDAVTQQELNQCSQAEYDRADTRLNEVYGALQADLSSDARSALTSAEVAWIAFRDLDCAFARSQFEGGSIAPLIYNSCLTNHTEARTRELQGADTVQTSYQQADAQLNTSYQALLDLLSADNEQAVTTVQLSWLEYRDRNCAFESLYASNAADDTQCLARMSETRTTQIQQDIEQRSL